MTDREGKKDEYNQELQSLYVNNVGSITIVTVKPKQVNFTVPCTANILRGYNIKIHRYSRSEKDDDNPPVPKGRRGEDRQGEEHVVRMVQSQNLQQ